MNPHFIPNEFTEDPLNSHYDDRRTWLSWRDVAPPRESARRRFGRRLIRVGRWLEGFGAACQANQT